MVQICRQGGAAVQMVVQVQVVQCAAEEV